MDKVMRRVNKWVDRNPLGSSLLTVALCAALAFLFWGQFGGTLRWAYTRYVAARLDPVLAAHVTPHFTALRDLMREKIPAMEKIRNLFVYRAVDLTASKEL